MHDGEGIAQAGELCNSMISEVTTPLIITPASSSVNELSR